MSAPRCRFREDGGEIRLEEPSKYTPGTWIGVESFDDVEGARRWVENSEAIARAEREALDAFLAGRGGAR